MSQLTSSSTERHAGVHLRGPTDERTAPILSDDALAFVADLVRTFRPKIRELLRNRQAAQAARDAGEGLRFLDETKSIREGNWTVAPLPADLQDRRVEITGPVDRKMVINALNSGAKMFMADFEDANSPTWANCTYGQRNLYDAIRRQIDFTADTGKEYRLRADPAVLLVRPRGLHLVERHLEVDGEVAPASLFDFGLYFFHNAKALLESGSGPYFYLPKLQHHLEARLWNDVFVHAQKRLGIPEGTIKATVLIETLPAAFQMDEILYELREHSAGLNCGRWDYIFSFIKVHREDPTRVLPDRGQVGMTQPFMRAYTQLVIRTCHRRGVHAMGGMAAQIPIKNDEAANEAALSKVRTDKEREVEDGHDGTWVAHPALVSIAQEIFDAKMPGKNQIDKKRDDVEVTEAQLVEAPDGNRTMDGLRHNIRVGVQYIEAWLRGQGCVPLYHLMEDAATAEISRAQIWQWLHHSAVLDDGSPLTVERFRAALHDEMARIEGEVGADRFQAGRFSEAKQLFDQLSTAGELVPFLTLPAYERLCELESA